jgi:hypothetical protein
LSAERAQSAPDRTGVPVADATRHGSGVYRRRIRIETVAPGVVLAEMEDDYHHFRCTLRHDGHTVTACDGEAVRFPWATCPGATVLLGQLAGMPLSPRSTAVGGHADVGDQCTHLFDLAGLAVAHAHSGRELRTYAIDVPDRKGTTTWPVLRREGAPLFAWTVEGEVITAPDLFEGQSLRSGFMRWAEAELEPDVAEAAIVMRRATMISWGRALSLDSVEVAAELPTSFTGRCHTFSEAHVHVAVRMKGTTLDFTDAAERLLTD